MEKDLGSNRKEARKMNQKINPKNWTNIQSYLRDTAASVPKHCNKLSPTMQDTQNSWLPSAYKSYIYTILQSRKCVTVLCTCVLSCFSHVRLFATPWTAACQTPLSMGFSRQEHWGGLPCPPPGIFLTQRSNPHVLRLLPLAREFFTTSATWEAKKKKKTKKNLYTLI